jgi:hypothetical protein
MAELKITTDTFNFVYEECKKFRHETQDCYDVTIEDVFYSYFNSTNNTFHVLRDWDEGENNDPFWNKKKDEHSVYVFLKEMCEKLANLKDDSNKHIRQLVTLLVRPEIKIFLSKDEIAGIMEILYLQDK